MGVKGEVRVRGRDGAQEEGQPAFGGGGLELAAVEEVLVAAAAAEEEPHPGKRGRDIVFLSYLPSLSPVLSLSPDLSLPHTDSI